MTVASHTWSLPEQVNLPPDLAAFRGRTFILYHPTTPPLARAIREGQAFRKLRGHAESVAVLIWALRPFPPPSAAVKEVFRQAFADGPQIDAAAWVVDTELVMGTSIVRSISTQVFGDGVPTSFFRDPFDAAAWLESLGAGEAREILSGLEELDRATPDARFNLG